MLTAKLNADGHWVLAKDGNPIAVEHDVHLYKNTPVGTGSFFNNHHPVQDAWALGRLGNLPKSALKDPGVVYRSGDEPGIMLRDRYSGSPHQTISARQSGRAGNIATRNYATERAEVQKDLDAAKVPAAKQAEILQRADAYFKTLHDNIKDPALRTSIFGDYFSKE